MTFLYGWGPSDQRVTEFILHGHWATITLMLAIDCKGSWASMVTNGRTTWSIRTIRRLAATCFLPEEIVIIDNQYGYTSSWLIEKVLSAGVEVLFQPPYMPDLNPIEQIFSNIKANVCCFGARTGRRLYTARSKVKVALTHGVTQVCLTLVPSARLWRLCPFWPN